MQGKVIDVHDSSIRLPQVFFHVNFLISQEASSQYLFSVIYLSIVPCQFGNIQACVSSPVKKKRKKRKNRDFQNDSLNGVWIPLKNSSRQSLSRDINLLNSHVKIFQFRGNQIFSSAALWKGEWDNAINFSIFFTSTHDDITNTLFSDWKDNCEV